MSLLNGRRPPAGILNGPGEIVPFSPPGSTATYLIRQPIGKERPRFKAALARELVAENLRAWGSLEMLRLARAEVARIMDAESPAERDQSLLDELDAHLANLKALWEEWGRSRSPEAQKARDDAQAAGTPRLQQVEQLLQEVSESYRNRVADNNAFNNAYADVQGWVAAKAFLAGWEDADLPPFRRERDGVPDDLLGLVPGPHLVAIGGRVAELIDPSEEARKNSASASSGGSSPPSSTTSTGPGTPPPTSPSGTDPGTSASSGGTTSASTPPTS